MGRWVSREEDSVNNPGTEPVETVAQLNAALGDGGCRMVGDIRDLAAFGKS